MTPPRDGLLQMIQQNDEKHDEAHRRLRQDLDRLEEQVNKGFNSLREGFLTNSSRIETVANTPIDATKLVLNTKVVVALLVMVLGIAAAVWTIRSGMDRLSDRMEATAKLQDVQSGALKTAVDEMRRRQELQQYELQSLKEAILAMKAGKGK